MQFDRSKSPIGERGGIIRGVHRGIQCYFEVASDNQSPRLEAYELLEGGSKESNLVRIGGIDISYGDGSLVKIALEEHESALWVFFNLSDLKGAV